MNDTAAIAMNEPAARAWLATSSDLSTADQHEPWVEFLRIDTGLAAGDLAGVAATLTTFACAAAGVLEALPAVEGLRAVETRDGDVHVEVALATGIVLTNDGLDLTRAVGYSTSVDAAVAILAAVVAAANEAIDLYRVAPVEV